MDGQYEITQKKIYTGIYFKSPGLTASFQHFQSLPLIIIFNEIEKKKTTLNLETQIQSSKTHIIKD